jgi:molecular chaperone DnaK
MMQALSDAKLSSKDLDLVLLVGGSTRIPSVRRLVSETLGLEPKPLIDPDLAVARGAAIQAGILEGSFETDQELVLTDVCPFTLGVEIMQEGFFEDRLVFYPIIPRNTTIPAERSHIVVPYTDYQTKVNVKAYQGDSSDPEQNEFLGEVMLTGIPPAKKEKSTIEIKFSYNMNGILQVNARVLSNNNEVSAEISTTRAKAKAPLDLSKWEGADGAKKLRPVIRKAEKLILAEMPGFDELELLVDRAKEALLLGEKEQTEELRKEMIQIIKLIEEFSEEFE